MGYRMRFVSDDTRGFSITDLEETLAAAVPDCRVKPNGHARDVYLGEDCLWEIEVCGPGAILAEERDILLERMPSGDAQAVARVRTTLTGATAMIFVRFLHAGREMDRAFELIDDLWAALFARRSGVIEDFNTYWGTDSSTPILG